jgi:hypothetical protein
MFPSDTLWMARSVRKKKKVLCQDMVAPWIFSVVVVVVVVLLYAQVRPNFP